MRYVMYFVLSLCALYYVLASVATQTLPLSFGAAFCNEWWVKRDVSSYTTEDPDPARVMHSIYVQVDYYHGIAHVKSQCHQFWYVLPGEYKDALKRANVIADTCYNQAKRYLHEH